MFTNTKISFLLLSVLAVFASSTFALFVSAQTEQQQRQKEEEKNNQQWKDRTQRDPPTIAPWKITSSGLKDESYGYSADFKWDTAEHPSVPTTAFPDLKSEVIFFNNDTLRIRVKPSSIPKNLQDPFVVPDLVFPLSSQKASDVPKASDPRYRVDLLNGTLVVSTKTQSKKMRNKSKNKKFSSQTKPHSSLDEPDEEIFRLGNVYFEDQFVRFSTEMTSDSFLTGFGERQYYYFLNHDLIPMSSDTPEIEGNNVSLMSWGTDQGTPWKAPMYAFNPMLFVADPKRSKFYGIFIAQSNVANLYITKKKKPTSSPSSSSSSPSSIASRDHYLVNFTFGGGILDIFVITGNSMKDVVAKYHRDVIWTANVPPYWSLGIHQCKWGYHTLTECKSIVAGYKNADLPLTTFWSDNDYDQPKLFLWWINNSTYPEQAYHDFVLDLLANDQHYVQIVDPAIATNRTYPVFMEGKAKGVFVNKSKDDHRPLVGTQWPGWSSFVDYSSPHSNEWWAQQLNAWRKKIKLSGSWLDMQEISSFGIGMVGLAQCNATENTPWTFDYFNGNWGIFKKQIAEKEGHCYVADSKYNYPEINLFNVGADWNYRQQNWWPFSKTIDMTGWMSTGSYYDSKSFYGSLMSQSTYDYYKKADNTRPFLLSRATTFGSGRWTAHWTGDNHKLWGPKQGGLWDSIQAVLWGNLAGLTMIGPDIGGFQNWGLPPSQKQEIMVRWYQSSCFVTFTRNHHSNDGTRQEPFLYDKKAQAMIRQSMFKKFELLPLYFTELMRSHLFGGSVLRHLSLEFPGDLAVYEESSQFMLASHILVNTVAVHAADNISALVPRGTWYSLWDFSPLRVETTQKIIFSSILYEEPIPALIRGGKVLPLHTSTDLSMTKTRNSGISIVCALDADTFLAEGDAFFDDGADGILPDDDLDLPAARKAVNMSKDVRWVSYRCSFNPATFKFSFESRVLWEGSEKRRSHPLPLPDAAKLTVLFPPVDKKEKRRQGEGKDEQHDHDQEEKEEGDNSNNDDDDDEYSLFDMNQIKPTQIVLNGQEDVTKDCKISSTGIEKNGIQITLPNKDLDGSTPFVIEWTSSASPSYSRHNFAPSSPSSSPPSGSWNWGGRTTAVFFGGIVLGVFVTILFYALMERKQQQIAGEYSSSSRNLSESEVNRGGSNNYGSSSL